MHRLSSFRIRGHDWNRSMSIIGTSTEIIYLEAYRNQGGEIRPGQGSRVPAVYARRVSCFHIPHRMVSIFRATECRALLGIIP